MDGVTSDPASVSRGAVRRRLAARIFRPALRLGGSEEWPLLSVALVSVNGSGAAAGNSDSTLDVDPNLASTGNPSQDRDATSADGTLMVFQSDATDLVPGVYDSNKSSD